ncbi:hypothetical protein RCC89_11760 [Cytophagaceae bacterium ABcell3]|nr:hypothetical protein RCC89_11760 [Cytophagaceae bacterium ABcell3]
MKIKHFVIFGVVIAALVALHFYRVNSYKELLKSELTSTEFTSDSLNYYRYKSIADSLTLYGKIEEARRYYEKSDSVSGIKRNHQEKLQLAENYRNRGNLSKQLRNTLDKTRKELKERQDMLQEEAQKKDSLYNASELKVQNLQKEVAHLQEQLADTELNAKNSSKTGKVEFESLKGVKVYYVGDMRNGKAHGQGYGLFNTGGVYEGEWKNNLRHGKGVYSWKDGSRYEGEYYGDQRQGKGTYFFASGEKYIGEWMNNKRSGKGTMYDKEGEVIVSGIWKDDEIKEEKEITQNNVN